MMMHNKKNKGFSVVELIVVLAIIAILAAVGIPMYNNVLQKAKYEADNASIVVLNQASVAYAITSQIEIPDIFEGIGTDADRMQQLVDATFLSANVSPQQHGAEFNWVIADQVWVINGGMSGSGGGGPTPPPDGEIDLSEYPGWDPTATYDTANTYIVYDGKLYYNLWWVNGSTLPGTAQVWQQVTDDWVYFNIYNDGDTVEYEGGTYRARYWTSGQSPVHSEYGPWELIP